MNMLTLICFIFMAFLGGCATIVSKSTWPVAINNKSTPVNFLIVNKKGETKQSGVTPATVFLNSGYGYFDSETYRIRFSKEGAVDSYATIDTSINGWYWGNILFGGIIGFLIVDPMTGAMWELPETVLAP